MPVLSSQFLLLQYHRVLLCFVHAVLIFHPFLPKSSVLPEHLVLLFPVKTRKILLWRSGELRICSAALCCFCESTTGTKSYKLKESLKGITGPMGRLRGA